MTDMYKLTEDGKGIVYIPDDTVAPNLQCVVDNLNDMSEQLHEVKVAFEKLGVSFDLVKDFGEWSDRIDWLDKTNRRLVDIEEIYQLESDRIIMEAIASKIDFNALYGANNQKVRQQYADEQLADLLEEKKELEFLKANDNRRISFLKRIIDLKINLIKYNNTDIELPK